jgi:hypothetical protein
VQNQQMQKKYHAYIVERNGKFSKGRKTEGALSQISNEVRLATLPACHILFQIKNEVMKMIEGVIYQ